MPKTARPTPARPTLATLPCMLLLAFGAAPNAWAQDAKPAEATAGVLQPVP